MFQAPGTAYVIAEAGVNHDGSEDKARDLIDIAAASGADAVKFQMFSPEALVTVSAPTAAYQAKNLDDRQISQRDMLKKLTLPDDAYPRLAKYCESKKLDFLCTPFDQGSLGFLVGNTHMRYLKLPSGEVTNGPFLLAAARTGLPVILSTGMSSMEEVGVALSVLHFGYANAAGIPRTLVQPTKSMLMELKNKVTLLHCVSQYPAPPEATNLRAMQSMAKHFGLPVGLSDHTQGIAMPPAAVQCGACMIEKHFTYDQNAAGPDHKASLMPDELKAMAAAIRSGKKIDIAEAWLGSAEKACQPVEENTRAIARRSVVAAAAIARGEAFSDANLACKRPATGGVAPNRLWELLGKKAKHDYAADAFINADELH